MKVYRFSVSNLIEQIEKIKQDHGDLRIEGHEKIRIVEIRNADDESIVKDKYVQIGEKP